MNYREIKLKYTIIAFILGLIPYSIILIFISYSNKATSLHINTIILFAILTSIANAIYIYISITKKIQNKNQL